MKKISEKTRRLLRKIYMVLGVTAISLLFQACYGMPMDDYCWSEDCTCTGEHPQEDDNNEDDAE